MRLIYTDATGTAIAFGTTYTIQWSSALYNVQALWDPTDSTRIRIKTAGLYLIDVYCRLTAEQFGSLDLFANYHIVGHVRVNGSSTTEPIVYAPATATADWTSGLVLYRLEAGDYLEVLLENQTAGTGAAINGTLLQDQPKFGLHMLQEG